MNKFVKEFKEFALKGNVLDMAVGIIIGAGFGKIVTSLVADVVMPPVGAMLGGVDFSHLKFVISQVPGQTEAVVIRYGAFLQTVLDFLIVAGSVFLLVKFFNKLKVKEALTPTVAPPKQELLLEEIRDLLKKERG